MNYQLENSRANAVRAGRSIDSYAVFEQNVCDDSLQLLESYVMHIFSVKMFLQTLHNDLPQFT